jgi:hypothetical protein
MSVKKNWCPKLHTRIQGELTSTAFRLVLSAGKLNLPLVPSQDYVLQDKERCYDKILSDWNLENTIVIVFQKIKYGKYHCKYSYFGCCKACSWVLYFCLPHN